MTEVERDKVLKKVMETENSCGGCDDGGDDSGGERRGRGVKEGEE